MHLQSYVAAMPCPRPFFKNKVIYLWLRWVFVAAHVLFSSCGERGYSSLWCAGFSCCRAQALGTWASIIVVRGL